ncbi:MAG TPA: hypothetical protein VF328_24695, partial [Mycobacterium sp.]
PRRGLPPRIPRARHPHATTRRNRQRQKRITEQFGIIRDQLADLWRRAEATTAPGWWRADPADNKASR